MVADRVSAVAKQDPASLASHGGFLIQIALSDQPHISIQGFAAEAALTLSGSGHLPINPDTRQQLLSVNVSRFPVEFSNRYKRVNSKQMQERENQGDRKFHFGFDMGPDWFDSLGACFAMSQVQIETEAADVIVDEWGYSGYDHWESDERARRKIFRDGETYHSHGSYPRTDDLRFYLAYHAMMTVAGRLLATVPVHQDPEDPEHEFAYWLSRHGLSRDDGNWLADRRDPVPFDWPNWKDEKQKGDWRRSVLSEDFERILGLSGSRLNLWGHWTFISGNREESISVGSAFVSPERSDALLRALQTVSNPDDYHIPDANDDSQINSGGFVLKGWVVDHARDNELDGLDPWAGDIKCPPIMPAQFVRDIMRLDCDSESRTWHRQNPLFAENVLWSQIWGCLRKQDNEPEHEAERGRRLQASHSFVMELIRTLNMNLIVKVAIRREIRHSPYEGPEDYDRKYIPPRTRLFLLKSDGRICAI